MTSTGLEHAGDPPAVTEIRVAEVAATAARSIAGVAHLQPGLWGLVQQLGTEVWTQVTGRPRPDTAGVQVSVDVDPATGSATLSLDITLVVDGRLPAARVAGDVQRGVGRAVRDVFGVVPDRVAVHIADVTLPV